jgi:Flp pilus assembly protein TadD
LLASLDIAANRSPSAEKRFREVLQYNPGMESAYLGLADALDRQGKSDEALAMLNGRLRDNPDSIVVLKAIGLIQFRAGNLREAKARFNRVLEVDPKNADAHVDLGLIAMKDKHFEEAIDEFDAAMRLKPDWPQALKLRKAAEDARK